MERGLKGFDGIEFTIVDEVFFVLLEHETNNSINIIPKKDCTVFARSVLLSTALYLLLVTFYSNTVDGISQKSL